VHSWTQPHDAGSYILFGQSDHGILGVDTKTAGHGVVLGELALEAGRHQPSGRVRADERFA
jgi:hypothetical protein